MATAFPKLPAVTGLDHEGAAAHLMADEMNFLLDVDGNFVGDHAQRSGLIREDEG